MILVDTSVLIEHIRRPQEKLGALLIGGEVLVHPFVLGELALGQLGPREAILRDLQDLPPAGVASNEEVLHLIERHRLFGIGIGYVDVHLLASARLMGGAALWTFDQRLCAAAKKLGVAYSPTP